MKPPIPDARLHHNPDPTYLRELLDEAGISQREWARRLGAGERTVRSWLQGTVQCPYSAQYVLEALAAHPPQPTDKR